VSWRVDGNDACVIAERPTAGERSEWAIVKREWLGSESRRERLTQDATHDPRHRRAEELKLRLIEQDAPAHVDQPVDVVAMGVGEYDLGNIVEGQTGRGHRGWEFLFACDFHPRERDVPRRGGLAGVDES
jgi:hypothetical protein